MHKDIFSEIGKYLAGEMPQEQASKLQNWINSSPENRELYNEIRELWNETRIKDRFNNSELIFEKILDNINQEDTDNHLQPYTYKRSWFKRTSKVISVAAAILIFVLCGFSVWYIDQSRLYTENKEDVKAKLIKKINQAGQKSKIHLPDGSIAILNAESELEYYEAFSDSARDVYLSGEAFFEVAKDRDKPFRVHSNDVSVTALGTAFNFSAFQDKDRSEVALLEGKIKIDAGSRTDILEEGEVLVHERNRNKIEKQKVDVTDFIAWKDGILIFNEKDFNEIKERLERWYGVTIKIKGRPKNNFKFYGRFDNEYLSNVLKSMRYGNNFNYTIEGKEVTIHFK